MRTYYGVKSINSLFRYKIISCKYWYSLLCCFARLCPIRGPCKSMRSLCGPCTVLRQPITHRFRFPHPCVARTQDQPACSVGGHCRAGGRTYELLSVSVVVCGPETPLSRVSKWFTWFNILFLSEEWTIDNICACMPFNSSFTCQLDCTLPHVVLQNNIHDCIVRS